MIRDATPADAGAIAAIYAHYVRETTVTFEEEPPGTDEIASRLARVAALGLPYVVIEAGGRVRGYAYAGRFHERSAYRRSVESTIYLAPDATGQGLGLRLYGALLERLRERELHTALALVTIPNPASVALHERLGFAPVGRLREVGFKLGRWIDVGYWQLLL